MGLSIKHIIVAFSFWVPRVMFFAMLFTLLILYIYAYCRVRYGSKLADVKLISVLFIVCSAASIVTLCAYIYKTRFIQDYANFSATYQAQVNNNLVSRSFS